MAANITYVDKTHRTYDSAFCQLKPGTLVRLKDWYNANPFDFGGNDPRNIGPQDILMYLGILDTKEHPDSVYLDAKDASGKGIIFETHDEMHCWLKGEHLLCVNDFRPPDPNYQKQAGLLTELDAIEIISE